MKYYKNDLKLNLYASLEYMLNNNMYNEYSKLLCARSTELKKRELTKLLKVIKK